MTKSQRRQRKLGNALRELARTGCIYRDELGQWRAKSNAASAGLLQRINRWADRNNLDVGMTRLHISD